MKKILKSFIFILSFSIILFTNLYDSKAFIYEGVEVRPLETSSAVDINDDVFYPIVINDSDNDAEAWLDYMQENNITIIRMQATELATISFYDGNTKVVDDTHDVFMVDLTIQPNTDKELDFVIKFYRLSGGLRQQRRFASYNTSIYWQYPSSTKVYTNVIFQVVGAGYDETDLDNAFNDGKAEGLDEGYDNGYEQGRDDYGYYDTLTDEWLTYDDGYTLGLSHGYSQGYDEGYANGLASGITEGYTDGWSDAITDYIDNTLPGLLAQANQEGYNDGLTAGLLEGYDDGYADGITDGYTDGLANGLLEGYDNGYDEGFADGLDETTYVLGSLTYSQSTSTDYSVNFSLPTHNSSTNSVSEILENVSASFSGRDLAIYTVRQPKNITYEYELRNGNYDIIEIMPEFDMILFMGATDEMVILLNGNVIKYYNNSMGIEAITLRYTGFPNEDYQNGYQDGLHDGLLDGQTLGFMDGYNEARRELWTTRYELGYNEARDDYGYYDEETNEWITANVRYMVGYYDGLEVNNSEAFNTGYNKGFREGSTDSFNAKLSDWIVPAIVIVLFLGGAIVILNRRVGGRND